jgi:hypothetical protein
VGAFILYGAMEPMGGIGTVGALPGVIITAKAVAVEKIISHPWALFCVKILSRDDESRLSGGFEPLALFLKASKLIIFPEFAIFYSLRIHDGRPSSVSCHREAPQGAVAISNLDCHVASLLAMTIRDGRPRVCANHFPARSAFWLQRVLGLSSVP